MRSRISDFPFGLIHEFKLNKFEFCGAIKLSSDKQSSDLLGQKNRQFFRVLESFANPKLIHSYDVTLHKLAHHRQRCRCRQMLRTLRVALRP